MVRELLDEKPPESEDEPQTEMKVLNSPWFSDPVRVARRQQVLREMRGRMHGGHR